MNNKSFFRIAIKKNYSLGNYTLHFSSLYNLYIKYCFTRRSRVCKLPTCEKYVVLYTHVFKILHV
jgi:hypothetical protein